MVSAGARESILRLLSARFSDMTAVAIDVSQELSLLQLFEPEVNLAGHPRVWEAAQKLRDALRQVQKREAVAEYEWKKQ